MKALKGHGVCEGVRETPPLLQGTWSLGAFPGTNPGSARTSDGRWMQRARLRCWPTSGTFIQKGIAILALDRVPALHHHEEQSEQLWTEIGLDNQFS